MITAAHCPTCSCAAGIAPLIISEGRYELHLPCGCVGRYDKVTRELISDDRCDTHPRREPAG